MTTDYQTNPLLDAVDELTKERTLHTTIIDDDTGEWMGIHSEKHPPLLTMLIKGTGISKNGGSSDPGIPIDADALELWGKIRDTIRLWCRQLDASYMADDLNISVRHWYAAHTNAYRSKKISETTDKDVTRMVEGWVRMIETKFDPPEKREWQEPCPARIPTHDVEGEPIGHRVCGARRIVVNGEERFAITLNVTTMTAECARCKTRWVGDRGVLELRQMTELQKLIHEEDEAARVLQLARATNSDTPQQVLSEVAE